MKKAAMLVVLCSMLLLLSSNMMTLSGYLNNKNCQNKLHNFNQMYTSEDNSFEYLYPSMDIPVNIEEVKLKNECSKVNLTDTPSEFSWKNYQGKDLTTPARHQGQCGSCWAFGAVGAIESLINIKENFTEVNIDLSEQYLLSCMPAAGSCSGGNSASPFSYIIDTSSDGNLCNGIIFEDCLAYQANDDIPCSQKTNNWMDTLVPLSGFGEVWFGPDNPEAVDTMKAQIYQNGPIYALMYVDDSFRLFGSLVHQSDKYYGYRNINDLILNHAILIVGWKDDSNLRNGGYWICKNSWGTEWGYDGFFNMEYGSMNINCYMAWPEYDESSFNCPPIADAGGYYYGRIQNEIVLDGSNCVDPEGHIVSYEWDFGDGTIGEEMSPSHVYQESGVFLVALTVTDDNQITSTDTAIVCIEEETIEMNIIGGLGITIEIENPYCFDITNTLLTVNVEGLIQNMDIKLEEIEIIPAYDTYSISLPIIGFGKGTVHVHYENIDEERVFYSIGPFLVVKPE